MNKYSLLVLFLIGFTLFLFYRCATKTFSWEINTVKTKIIRIEAEQPQFQRLWCVTDMELLNFRLAILNKTSQKIYFYPLRLSVSGFDKLDQGIGIQGVYASYSPFSKFYLDPNEKKFLSVYVVVNDVDLEKEPNLKLYVNTNYDEPIIAQVAQ